jgi:serine/threonine protein kinase
MITPSKTLSSTFPYRIEEKIGAGGMGVVYRAFEPALNRRVAIKVLRTQGLDDESPALVDEYRRRFLQEARAAAALSHPGVTTIYRVGEEDGSPYIAMEWLDGRTLEDVLLAEGTLPPARVAKIGVELLETLEAAHRAGVVHRDIKPSNLIVLGDGRLKVTDFGIARVQNSDLVKTGTGTVLATPQFASPEQLQGLDVDGRSDVFSTGVVLYLSLAGRYPFDGRSFFELMAAIARGEATPLRQVKPDVSDPLEHAIMRAIRRDASERHATAAELAAELRPLAGVGPSSLSEASTQSFSIASAPDTIRDPVPASYPTMVGVPRSAQQAVVRVVEAWPSRGLGSVGTSSVLARLLERPLHAPPFAGGVFIGGYCLLVYGGCIVGAVDAKMRSCDEVCDRLPDEAVVTLHPAPDDVSPNLVPLLATLVHPPKVKKGHLDTSIVNLPALAARLSEEKFEGVLRLGRDDATGFIFFDAGAPVLSLFSDGWDDFPVTTTWESWMSRAPIDASLEEKVWIPAQLSYRKELKDFGFLVAEPTGSTAASRLKQTFLKKTSSLQAAAAAPATTRLTPVMRPSAPDDIAAMQAFYSGDPAYRFLEWALEDLPAYFQERDRSARWKYLVDWIPLVRRATLHHALPRPDQREADDFDLVTFDASDKVLHVGHRVPCGTPEALAEFVERVVQAKKARTKTGDVGGAFLISPRFDESMIEAYQAATRPQGTGLLSVEEKITKYEGFIRMGPRRGFHLLLVAEKPDGFEPLLLV